MIMFFFRIYNKSALNLWGSHKTVYSAKRVYETVYEERLHPDFSEHTYNGVGYKVNLYNKNK